VARQGVICILAKSPEAGSVKTRLVPVLGEDGAAALAIAFLQDTWASVSTLDWANAVVASTSALNSASLSGAAEIWPQGEGDLGARLERILQRALESAPLAIAVGADSPGLPIQFLERARDALKEVDAVIGPCSDGGFYLLGLRRCSPGLLSGIPWSDRQTYERTVAKLRAAGLTVRFLEPWFDVDRPEDLARLETLITEGKVHAPRTGEFLWRFSEQGIRGPRITVIIPVLNEFECLPATLAHLRQQHWVHEVIVVDGGSTDGTREWLEKQSFARVVDALGGRGPQLNAGASAARGDILLFLHAECLLPSDAGERIQSALKIGRVVGGCFRVRFGENRRSLRLVAAGINFRVRMTRTGTGDQAIFVRKCAFDEAGGCPDWPLFEDVELVRRVKKLGRFQVSNSAVSVSPRRHIARGVFRTVFLIYVLRLAFWAGVSPFTLKKWFDDVRPHLKDPKPKPASCVPQQKNSRASVEDI
jgi:uncharacterized protein